MKNFQKLLLVVMAVVVLTPASLKAQEEEASSPIDLGVDVYSSYIWRGAKFGSGPAFQPWMEAGFGGLSIGAWGSVSSSFDEGFEMDLYAGYSFDFGLGIAVTDYYFGDDWTEFDSTHYIEPALSYEIGGFSILAAYMFMPGFEDGDTYLEAGYSFGILDVGLGVGDGQYTSDGDFNLCNITLGASKEIEITDSYALPISAGVTLNPSTGGFFIYAGISF